MKSIQKYQSHFIAHLNKFSLAREPKQLYDPVQYILNLGGKRLRPMLTLMTTDCFGGEISNALDASLAIELFHNFSLIHDDIMDKAPLRRGKQTVHEKWDINTGILSGDAMLIMAYKLLESYNSKYFKQLTTLFSNTALEVCEGQQYDINFETRVDVSVQDYVKMVKYKTAVLVGTAMQMGAILAEANNEDQKRCYDFGINLGIAFQLKDDYLDAFGNPENFGKQLGGDIIENKKTYLFLKAMELGSDDLKNKLSDLFEKSSANNDQKIIEVIEVYNMSGAKKATERAIENYTTAAFDLLNLLDIESSKKQVLIDFGTQLMTRTS
ncbi:MAG: polyprenyl synthetase [Formosa sp.]|mgnify:FL=1|nr:polyprenyl synthetase [Formosa sp.]|tara:strand:+ start:10556 stop:11530 length:975 start_codon:yes stop_codon:yes gene_type:complete